MKTDLELIKSVRENGDDESFNEICQRYENIFYKVCQKYATTLYLKGVNPQEIFDEKNFIVLHCIKTFKPSKKVKLGTWIGNYARYLCLNSINAQRFVRPSTDDEIQQLIEDTQVANNYSTGSTTNQEDHKYVMNLLDQLKDDRIKTIFKYRYLYPKKLIWAQIARKMHISSQTAMNLHNRGLKLLRNKIKSENISDVL